MTLTQRNILANLLGQSSNAVLIFFFLPAYIHYLGMEAYGIVGFYTALQITLSAFDLGLSMSANRELALLSGRPGTSNEMRSLVNALQRLSWLLACALGILLFLCAPLLAQHWLRPTHLEEAEVTQALQLMALAVLFQWPSVFYAGCVTGLQQQGTLNLILLAGALGRFPGVVLLLAFVAPTLQVFFLGQIVVSAGQTLAIACLLWRRLPPVDPGRAAPTIRWQRLRHFAAGISGISALALVLTQLDKLLLSRYLPLDQFGYYSLASTFAWGLSIVSSPIYLAMFPKFSQLVDAGNTEELRVLYHRTAQFLTALLLPISAALVVFPETALLVWTNDPTTAQNAKTILRLLALGTTINCMLLVPHALQLAHGWTRLALCINTGLVIVFIPLILILAPWAAGEGAALAWLIVNCLYLLISIPLMHRRLFPRDFWRWCCADVLLPLLPVLAINGLLALLVAPQGRWEGAGVLLLAVLAGLGGALATLPLTRARSGSAR